MSATATPALAYEPMHEAAATIKAAAKPYFLAWLVHAPRVARDIPVKSYQDAATQAVAAAVCDAWREAEKEAERIAGEALRNAFAAEAGR